MSKTLLLRQIIAEKLNSVQGQTYHRRSPANSAYPFKVYSLSSVYFPDAYRDDIEVEIDVWDRSETSRTIEEIADQIEHLFNNKNLPVPPIYPTFFREGRTMLEDPDKGLQHLQLRFLVQLYETEE